jgi:hypothetical protein
MQVTMKVVTGTHRRVYGNGTQSRPMITVGRRNGSLRTAILL